MSVNRPARRKTVRLTAEQEAKARERAEKRLAAAHREVQTVEAGLTDLSVGIRRMILARGKPITKREIADTFGVTVSEVSRCLVEIRSVAPIEKPKFLEEREVDGFLVFSDEVESLVFHDLAENEALMQAWAGNPISVTLASVRVGLFNQLQLVRANRMKVLQDIGLLRRPAIEVNVHAVANLAGDALAREIADIDNRIREIEERGADANIFRSGIADAETEALPADAEGPDLLPG